MRSSRVMFTLWMGTWAVQVGACRQGSEAALATGAPPVAAAPSSLVPVTGDAALTEVRVVADALVTTLGAALKARLAEGGPAAAVDACRTLAPQLAREASERSGWTVGRVGTRTRNPANAPRGWQVAALAALEGRVQGSEHHQVEVAPDGTRTLQYARALHTQPLCLACHGEKASLAPQVVEALGRAYPADEATGYALGSLRGAVVVERRL